MTAQRIFLGIFLVYIFGFCAHAALLHKTVYGDGIFYYSWVRSAVVDHDIDFINEYAHFGVSQPKTILGEYGNKYSVGAAVLWYPWFLWTHTIVKGTGYELPYQLAIGVASMLYVFTGFILLYRLLLTRFTQQSSLFTMLAIAGATNLLFYGSLDTVNSHAVSFFASVMLLTFLLEKEKKWFRIGCLVGLVALIRTQDSVLALAALPFFKKPQQFLLLAAGALYVFIPQLLVWQILYGKFWVSPYVSTIEGFNFLQPHIIGVLFSLSNGLFLWTPVVVIGIVGLLLHHKTQKILVWMAISILAQLYIVASWSIWWQGASYSGRMFVSSLPFIAFGIANLLSHFLATQPRKSITLLGIITPLVLINSLLILFFLIRLH